MSLVAVSDQELMDVDGGHSSLIYDGSGGSNPRSRNGFVSVRDEETSRRIRREVRRAAGATVIGAVTGGPKGAVAGFLGYVVGR